MQERYLKNIYICLLILCGVVITFALKWTSAVTVPLAFSFFIFAVVSPVLSWMQKRLHLSRWASVLFTLFIILFAAGVVIYFVSISLSKFIDGAGAYRERLLEFITWSVELAAKLNLKIDDTWIRNAVEGMKLWGVAKNITGALIGFLGSAAFTLIFVFFLILGESGAATGMWKEIRGKISRYVAVKVFTSLVTALFTWIVLASFGVDLAFMFAVLTFLLNFIPSLGSIIATLLPLPIILLQHGFGFTFVAVLILTSGIQFLVGNIFEPKLMGQRMQLHPVVVLVFLVFWGLVWGIPGMFLAVPITSVLKIVLERIEVTRPIARVLEGRFE